jgi:hypothetical protein
MQLMCVAAEMRLQRRCVAQQHLKLQQMLT